MKKRLNISFEQILNQIRKDERDIILETLTSYKNMLVTRQDFAGAAAVRNAIQHVRDHVYPGLRMRVDEEGIPE